MKKRCTRCKKIRTDFFRRRKAQGGYETTCKKCKIEQGKWNQTNTVRGRANRIFSDCKKAVKLRGHAFDLDIDWIIKKIENGRCEVTGLPFVLERKNPWMPSIDRKDPKKGYIKRNCQMVVWIYNTAKQEFKHEDVVKLAKAIIHE